MAVICKFSKLGKRFLGYLTSMFQLQKFLYYHLTWEYGQKLSVGKDMKGINFGLFQSITLPYPTIQPQPWGSNYVPPEYNSDILHLRQHDQWQ
jgi:hypothetical protein